MLMLIVMMMMMLQLLQNIVEMVDDCKTAVKSFRQQCQLTTIRAADSQTDTSQRTGLVCRSYSRHSPTTVARVKPGFH